MTAENPIGPWTRIGIALAGFAHNPQVVLAPNGSIILFHIGTALPAGCLANCTGTSGHTVQPRPAGCPNPSHALSVAVADDPAGPFRRFPYILDSPTQPGGATSATNPSALLLDSNGTLLLTFRRATSATVAVYRGHCDTPQGPWFPQSTAVLHPTVAGTPATFEEDPFLYRTPRGFHMLTHREVGKAITAGRGNTPPPLGPWLCGGGHIYSTNLQDWFYGESVYGGSSSNASQCYIDFASSSVRRDPLRTELTTLTSRQRPTIFTDASTKKSYLFTGASVNQSEYLHSFTLVQQINVTTT
jgi:hypothetical protein